MNCQDKFFDSVSLKKFTKPTWSKNKITAFCVLGIRLNLEQRIDLLFVWKFFCRWREMSLTSAAEKVKN